VSRMRCGKVVSMGTTCGTKPVEFMKVSGFISSCQDSVSVYNLVESTEESFSLQQVIHHITVFHCLWPALTHVPHTMVAIAILQTRNDGVSR
jgi:hypothetical protein